MQLEVLGQLAQARAQAADLGHGQRGVGRHRPGVAADLVEDARPATDERAHDVGRDLLPLGEHLAVLARQGGELPGREHAALFEPPAVALGDRGMRADLLVHHRLGGGRLVGLVVAVAAIADEVDDDVLLEGHAVVDRQLGHVGDGFRIVAVDVEDGRLHDLADVGAVEGRAHVQRMAGGEADAVVDDDVDGATGGVAARLRKVERLVDHALPGERGVAVQEDRHHLAPIRVVALFLAGPGRALGDRVDDLEVRRVVAERHVHEAPRRGDVGRVPLVVLHIARDPFPLMQALELLEEHFGRFAHDVDQHVEPPAVGHADDHLLHALGPGAADDGVERGDGGFAPLQRETLLAGVGGVQVLLDPLRRDQPGEKADALVGGEARARARRFQARLNPAFLFHLGDVQELGADGARVGLANQVHDLVQGHLGAAAQAARVEDRAAVRVVQPVKARLEVRNDGLGAQPYGIHGGAKVPEAAVRLDQAHDAELLGHAGLAFGGAAVAVHAVVVAVVEVDGAPGRPRRLAPANPRLSTGRRSAATPPERRPAGRGSARRGPRETLRCRRTPATRAAWDGSWSGADWMRRGALESRGNVGIFPILAEAERARNVRRHGQAGSWRDSRRHDGPVPMAMR